MEAMLLKGEITPTQQREQTEQQQTSIRTHQNNNKEKNTDHKLTNT